MAKKYQGKVETLKGAALIMERLYQTGIYQGHKSAKKHLEDLSQSIKGRILEDEMRREFKQLGVVAKYQRMPVYETDWEGLMDYLSDLGILIPLLQVDVDKLKEDPELHQTITTHFQNPIEQYIRMTPNKQGKVSVVPLEVTDLETEQLATLWLDTKRKFQTFDSYLEHGKIHMRNCPLLKKARKVSCNYGSVSLLDKDPTFNNRAIMEEYGVDMLKEIGKINMQSLDEYIQKGFISPNEIKQFRKVKDIQLRFIVQELASEDRQFQMFYRKLQQASANRQIG